MHIAPDEIRAQTNRILARFGSADRQKAFLQFIVEKSLAGQSSEIKEFLVAQEVYGRSADYDPRVDSIVRVEAARIRARLKEYYLGDGKTDPVVIELPKGTYVPVFRRFEPAEALQPEVEKTVVPMQLEAPMPLQPAKYRTWRPWVASALVVFVGAIWVNARWLTAKPVHTVAVVPFVNLTLDPSSDSLAGDITKEIEASLSRSGSMRLVERTSSQAFKPDFVVEGALRGDSQSRKLVVQLLNTGAGEYVWSADFPASSASQKRSELANDIVHAIRSQSNRYLTEQPPSGSPRAKAIALASSANALPRYDTDAMMMRGPSTIELASLAELNRSISLLEQAVAADASYAAAYVALSAYYTQAAEYDIRLLDKARESGQRALVLQPNLATAHYQLGFIYFLFDWNLEAAVAELHAALDGEPRTLSAYRLLADALTILGRDDEALKELEKARVIFPNHPVVETAVSTTLYNGHRFRELEEHARKAVRRFPDFPLAHWALGLALERQGHLNEAIQEEQTCLKASPRDGRCTAAIGHMYGLAGRRQDASDVLTGMIARPSNLSKYVQALIHNSLGQTELAYAHLEGAIANREFDVPYARVEPRFDSLRSQPRFQMLLKKIGLAP